MYKTETDAPADKDSGPFEYESVDLLPYDSQETLHCRLLRRFYMQFPDNNRNLIAYHFLIIALVDSVNGNTRYQ